MRGLLILGLSLSALVCACAPIGGQGRAAKKSEVERENAIVVSPAVVAKGNGTAPAWLAYGIAKLAMLEKAGAPPRTSVTDFDSEVKARTLMLAVWKDSRRERGSQDVYLDLLLTIKEAGFLREYVLAALARPGWTIPGEDLASLRLPDYADWAKGHVPNHQVLTMVEVASRKTPQHPRVFGESLPPPQGLSPESVPCSQSSARLTQANEAWSREARLLTAAPLAAANREQFFALVRWAADHHADYPKGVVWVSPKAYKIAFFTGFCAVDLEDYAASIVALRSAKTLLPASAEPRLEMVQSLAKTKQLDAAMEELDATMQLPMGKCMQGISWRKRGFVLFEQGRLKEAFRAYQKSLEFDAGNKIAYSELVLLAKEILQHEKLSPSDKRAYVAPAVPSDQLTTRCTE
jgi:tetratricopeptide (TPR) repeat protein